MTKYIQKLLDKRTTPLEKQLLGALSCDQVLNEYKVRDKKLFNETDQEYIDRLRKESESFTFICSTFNGKKYYVAVGVSGPIITPLGKFSMISAEVVGGEWGMHHFLFHPNLESLKSADEILIRIDSGCLSGMVLGDITCDCMNQLKLSQEMCFKNGSGMIVEIPSQDGRGWGDYKMVNQRLMDELSLNTVEAARAFYGHDDYIDRRTYYEAVLILKAIGFNEKHLFNLATNNPLKIKSFTDMGMQVTGSKSVVANGLSDFAKNNLKAKSEIWRHDLNRK